MDNLSKTRRYGELSSMAVGNQYWYPEEDVKKFVKDILFEMDNLNEKFEAIAMRCNVETMAGDALLGAAE